MKHIFVELNVPKTIGIFLLLICGCQTSGGGWGRGLRLCTSRKKRKMNSVKEVLCQ